MFRKRYGVLNDKDSDMLQQRVELRSRDVINVQMGIVRGSVQLGVEKTLCLYPCSWGSEVPCETG
jgi:hypothetical protein